MRRKLKQRRKYFCNCVKQLTPEHQRHPSNKVVGIPDFSWVCRDDLYKKLNSALGLIFGKSSSYDFPSAFPFRINLRFLIMCFVKYALNTPDAPDIFTNLAITLTRLSTSVLSNFSVVYGLRSLAGVSRCTSILHSGNKFIYVP